MRSSQITILTVCIESPLHFYSMCVSLMLYTLQCQVVKQLKLRLRPRAHDRAIKLLRGSIFLMNLSHFILIDFHSKTFA